MAGRTEMTTFAGKRQRLKPEIKNGQLENVISIDESG
jgi:hypothetical protein